ncbi:hypothetical protein Ccur_08170 [Cryptobacterium curtum DSM 15641]|uniref:Uncharacterized protein n=1 Tax=Cryptobacterium curtum (strain ATCC 700683 / DSM 15641 / CCUG 43107 / 12-3) TaxID=469378 RepID=C7MNN1_CRYCD|nr:hypothetical protein Ccur_08170 [Cryptobacterium curtum DSM 15641]
MRYHRDNVAIVLQRSGAIANNAALIRGSLAMINAAIRAITIVNIIINR